MTLYIGGPLHITAYESSNHSSFLLTIVPPIGSEECINEYTVLVRDSNGHNASHILPKTDLVNNTVEVGHLFRMNFQSCLLNYTFQVSAYGFLPTSAVAIVTFEGK